MTASRHFLHIWFCCFLLPVLLCSQSRAENFSWNLVEQDDRTFVTGRDLHRYFQFDDYQFANNRASWDAGFMVIRAQVGSHQLRAGDVLFNLTDAAREHNGDILISRLDFDKLLRPVLQPNFIVDGPIFDTVVIDPGHGGHDPGAVGNGVREKALALRLGQLLEEELSGRGFDVVMTRATDRFLPLEDRVEIANRHPNAIFLSLHYNSADNRSARGIETFALSPQGVAHYGREARSSDAQARAGNERDSENITLATAVHGSLRRATNAPDRGIRRARWTVLSGLEIPGILIEGGFISNTTDARLLASDSFIQNQAQAIVSGILAYRRAISR